MAYVKGEGIFESKHFTQNGSGVFGQNGFFWHPHELRESV